MKKIILTESQFKRLMVSSKDEKVIEEGVKEILLGAAMLLGVSMNAQNTKDAETALNNQETIENLNKFIENDSARQKLVDKFEGMGVNDVEERLLKNNKKLIQMLNKGGSEYDKTTKDFSKAEFDAKLKKGMGVIAYEEITKEILEDVVSVDTTIELSVPSNQTFKTGSFELSNTMSDMLETLVNDIKTSGYQIKKITIESSTDTEPIRKFISDEDPTGNKKLAQLRANAIKNILGKLTNSIEVVNKADNGDKNAYSRNMSPEAREQVRKDNEQYRYVKITVELEKDISTEPIDTKKEVIGYTCTLINVKDVEGKVNGKDKKVINFFTKTPEGSKTKTRVKCIN